MEPIEFAPSSSDGKGTPTKRIKTILESDSGGEDDPIVSGTIIPMTIRVEVTVASSGCKGLLTALLDSGCTRCLVSTGVVEKLEVQLRELKKTIAFSQLDGTVMGGAWLRFSQSPWS